MRRKAACFRNKVNIEGSVHFDPSLESFRFDMVSDVSTTGAFLSLQTNVLLRTKRSVGAHGVASCGGELSEGSS